MPLELADAVQDKPPREKEGGCEQYGGRDQDYNFGRPRSTVLVLVSMLLYLK